MEPWRRDEGDEIERVEEHHRGPDPRVHDLVALRRDHRADGGLLGQLQLTCAVPEHAVAPAAGQVMSGSQIAANAGNFASNAIASAMPGPPRVQANIGGMKLRLEPGSASVGDQVQDEIKDRLLHYAIVGGVLLFVCVIAIAVKLIF